MSVGRLEVLLVCGEHAGDIGRAKPEAGLRLHPGAQWPVFQRSVDAAHPSFIA